MKSIYSILLSAQSSTVSANVNTTSGSVQVPIQGRESEMMANRGGGIGFLVTDKTIVERILILGTGDGYYSNAIDNTKEAILSINKMLKDGKQ